MHFTLGVRILPVGGLFRVLILKGGASSMDQPNMLMPTAKFRSDLDVFPTFRTEKFSDVFLVPMTRGPINFPSPSFGHRAGVIGEAN